MEDSIEVRYAGVIVGRTAAVRGLDGSGAFVGIPEPLPVGTLVTLKMVDGTREARVEEVVESADPSIAGMRVRFEVGASAAAAPRVPAPPPSSAAPAVAAAPAPSPAAEKGAAPVDEEVDDASAPLAAPLSLAGPDAGGASGGGKKRRKRR